MIGGGNVMPRHASESPGATVSLTYQGAAHKPVKRFMLNSETLFLRDTMDRVMRQGLKERPTAPYGVK
eukprot:1159754-Pelagomonas_calceolata.AAC.3